MCVQRETLELDAECDAFISAVAKVSKKVVVLVQSPGAFLTPWRAEVSTIATMFLGGQETGGAWADIIFGDIAPAGRLPIELPVSDADTILPNPAPKFAYTEGLVTSYRNVTSRKAFEFGHGLTYSAFEWGDVKTVACAEKGYEVCLSMDVTNVGIQASPSTRALMEPATDTPQLYLQFPAAAQQPRSILKGFKKTGVLQYMSSETVTFSLTARDLSYYVVQSKSWVKVTDLKTIMYQVSMSSGPSKVVKTGPLAA